MVNRDFGHTRDKISNVKKREIYKTSLKVIENVIITADFFELLKTI